MGKIVKVKDMKPGWTYCPVDQTLEKVFWEQRVKEALNCKPEWLEDEVMIARAKEDYIEYFKDKKVIPNAGVLLKRPKVPKWEFDNSFLLYLMYETDELVPGPTPKGMSGVGLRHTGKKIWAPITTYPVAFKLDMEDEVMEARPFPVLMLKEGHEPIYLPNPEKWYVPEKNSPYNSRGIDHVKVWDETDGKILIILGIISFFMSMAGPSGCAMAITMWLFAAIGFKSKHDKKREYILKQRKELGVRGDGLDDHIL